MKALNFILPAFIVLFIACNDKKKKLEVVDLTLEQTVIDTPPLPPPPRDTNQLIKHFKEYVKIKPDSEIVVEAPKTKPSNAHIKGQDFLIINIRGENYIITFLNQNLPTNSLSNLKAFLQKNQSKINKDKIFVTGFTNSDKQKQFVKLLARYGISKFRVNPN